MKKAKPANASSNDPRDWPMKKKITAFLNAVFHDPVNYQLEMHDGEYRVTPVGPLSTDVSLTAIVIASHRYAIAAHIVSDGGQSRMYLYSDPDHPTIEDLTFRCKIEE